jgi:superfamily I DNA/RNA helicase
LRVDLSIVLTEVQARVTVGGPGRAIAIAGAPGAGKTTALAARALALAGDGAVMVICPHAASADAFRAALDRVGSPDAHMRVDTLAGHLCALMREDFVASGASPDLVVGSDADSRALAERAGATILDMTWPGFRAPGFVLDLPFLGRPDLFFDEAAGLFRQLRRWSVAPDEFERGCLEGVAAFYGDDVERARALCADPDVRAKASSRGREAICADAARLRIQRRAERELGALLSYLYREYVAAARGARVLCAEDVVDEGVRWLQRDGEARERLARGLCALIVDDAEDAEPATAALVDMLADHGVTGVAVASSAAAAIDGIGGRRALVLGADAERVDLAPRMRASRSASRFDTEAEEADAVSSEIRALLESGVPPADIMVLARDAAAAAVYATALGERGVPVAAPPSSWQSPADIADLLALACVVDDPYDHAHLLRVLASPLVGLSDRSLLALCRVPGDAAQLTLDMADADVRGPGPRGLAQTTLAENVLYGDADAILSDHGRESVRRFRERWADWRKRVPRMSAPEALAMLIDEAGYAAVWHAAPAALRPRLRDDARRLIAAVSRVAAGSLAAAARSIEAGLGCIEPARDWPEAVSCRTILGAKGVRKPYVFVVGVSHERFPRVYMSRGMAFSKRYGLVVRENVAGGAAQSAKFAWYYAKFGAKRLYLEEERRALEYALSRADVAARATGFGRPPRWAADQDLLAAHGA